MALFLYNREYRNTPVTRPEMFFKYTVPVPVVAGKISRQTTKSGTYILYVISRQYDPAKKHTVPIRAMIGKMSDEDGKMFPNEKFFEFFPDTPLPELRPASERSSTLMAGSYLAIEEVVRHYELDKILTKHFGERAGLVLDLASYMVVEGRNQGQYYPDYAYRHPLFTKDMRIVSDSTVSKFLSELTRDQIAGVLNDWNKGRDHKSRIYVSYDSTNKNCQAGDVDFVEFGKAKVDLGLPIFNIGLAMDQSNRVPLFYELYPGSVNDVSQLRFVVDEAAAYGYRNIGFIIDRGYFSKANIKYLDEHKYGFVLMIKGCKPLVSGLVDEFRGSFETKRGCSLPKRHVNGTTVKRKLFPEDKNERYLHLFYSPVKAMKDRCRFEEELEQMQQMFERCRGEQITFCEPHTRFFEFVYDNEQRLVLAHEKTEAIEKQIERCGYFCIVTSEHMSAQEAYELYYGRDGSEKLFRADKSFLGAHSTRVHSAAAVQAKMLIEFIGLIIRQRMFCLLKNEMLRLNVRKNYMTVPAAVKELEKIELVRVNSGRYQLDHAVTRNQEQIRRAFGLTKDHVMKRAAEIAELIAASGDAPVNDESNDEDDNELYGMEDCSAED